MFRKQSKTLDSLSGVSINSDACMKLPASLHGQATKTRSVTKPVGAKTQIVEGYSCTAYFFHLSLL